MTAMLKLEEAIARWSASDAMLRSTRFLANSGFSHQVRPRRVLEIVLE
jgi:hypothetical protein